MLILEANDEVAALNHAVGEIIKDLIVALCRAEIVEVIRLDVRDDCHEGAVAQKGGIGFVGFCHEGVASAAVCVGPSSVELPADGEGRIHPRLLERGDRHRGGRGLSMRAGEQHLTVAVHEFSQQV